METAKTLTAPPAWSLPVTTRRAYDIRMLLSNPSEILIIQDRWATEQILAACSSLTDEQLHRPFEMGPGSIHNTLVHMVGAMRVWADILAEREVRPRIEDGTKRSMTEIVNLHKPAADDLEYELRRLSFDQTVRRERQGKTYTFPRGGVLTHVTTHGMHHRAQCLNMLRHVGVKPLPPSSVVEWMIANGAV
jgi:uncharacterized damage-inducible protein DinB